MSDAARPPPERLSPRPRRERGCAASSRPNATSREASPAHLCSRLRRCERKPDLACGTDTELLLGEIVRVFDTAGGWCLGEGRSRRLCRLSSGVCRLRPWSGARPISSRRRAPSSIPARICVSRRSMRCRWAAGSRSSMSAKRAARATFVLDGGQAVIANHCRRGRQALVPDDYVSVAARFRRNALSLGRTLRLRHRLLRPCPTVDDDDRQERAARHRHAGDRAWRARSSATNSPRRPRLLERARRA